EPSKDQGLIDLRTLASGFRELGRASIAAPSAPVTTKAADPPPASPAPGPVAAEPKAAERAVFGSGDADVKPPTPISQALPPWLPETAIEKKTAYHGFVDLLIDERGRVVSAAIVRSVNARYDPLLLTAARGWTFKPATRNGRPV